MSFTNNKWIYILLILLGLVFLILAFYDIVYGKELMVFILPVLVVILFVLLILVIYNHSKKTATVEEFAKTLTGKLYHFKCPTCGGIFAVKKSKSNNKKPVKMTCPDCGNIGVIPPNPKSIEEKIPEKKSSNINFRCDNCGEQLTIWAEGSELQNNVKVYTCPYCGIKKQLVKS